jgi:hypothetical protein
MAPAESLRIARVRFSYLSNAVELISIVPAKGVPQQRVVNRLLSDVQRCSSAASGLSAQLVVDSANDLFGEPVGHCARPGKDRASLETRSESEADR